MSGTMTTTDLTPEQRSQFQTDIGLLEFCQNPFGNGTESRAAYGRVRNLAPALLAEVDRQAAEIERLRAEAERFGGYASEMDSAACAALKDTGHKLVPGTNWGEAAFHILPDHARALSQRIAALEGERDAALAAVEAARVEERDACYATVDELRSHARAMGDEWGRQQPGQEEHRKWVMRSVALEDAVAAIREGSK